MLLRHTLPIAALLVLAGCANQPDLGGTVHVGKVQAVFVEQYPGVFIDRRMADSGVHGKIAWVHVTFAQPRADGRTFAAAAVAGDLSIEPGDLVQMRFRATAPGSAQPAGEENRVMALIAKSGSQAARRFDGSGTTALERLTPGQRTRPPRPMTAG